MISIWLIFSVLNPQINSYINITFYPIFCYTIKF